MYLYKGMCAHVHTDVLFTCVCEGQILMLMSSSVTLCLNFLGQVLTESRFH